MDMRRIREVIGQRRISSLIDSALWKIVSVVRKYFYSWRSSDYGLKEAFFWPKFLDYWQRNSRALEHILREYGDSGGLVLDMGSGAGGIVELLDYFKGEKRFKLILADFDRTKVAMVKNRDFLSGRVIADATRLPFKRKSINFIVSIDLIEHLSAPQRSDFFEEITRVAKDGYLIHSPLDSRSGDFCGRSSDKRFQEEHLRRFKKKEPYTEEHLLSQYPDIEEILRLAPSAFIQGNQNAEGWLKFMTFYRRPIAGYLSGLLFLLKWKSANAKGPFYSGFIYNKIDRNP